MCFEMSGQRIVHNAVAWLELDNRFRGLRVVREITGKGRRFSEPLDGSEGGEKIGSNLRRTFISSVQNDNVANALSQ
jgi:hypothetical protein